MFENYKKTMHAFMEEYEYPIEAQEEIEKAFAQAFSADELLTELGEVLRLYEQDCDKGCGQALAFCNRVAKTTCVNVYSVRRVNIQATEFH